MSIPGERYLEAQANDNGNSQHSHQYGPPYGQAPPATSVAGYPNSQGHYAPVSYNNVAPKVSTGHDSSAVCTSIQQPKSQKSVVDAYILAIGLGFLGAHHFYLRRYGFGVIYFFTFGLFGVGYIADLFRIPCLVDDANREINEEGCDKKNLFDAYILWFPGGLFGFHNFYLERYAWGVLYLFTVGLFGIGWLVDGVRMRWLVAETNRRIEMTPKELRAKGLCEAYALTLFPITGLLGLQHYYLGRYVSGIYFTLTLGGCGVGWLMDICRMPIVVKRQNKILTKPNTPKKATLDDAYMYCFPLGFLGLHHFYLARYGWGVLYFFTFGLLGIGWVVDWFRLPCLVARYNRENFGEIVSTGGATVTVFSHTYGTVPHPQGAYPNHPAAVTYPGYQPYPGYSGHNGNINSGYNGATNPGQDSWSTITSSNVSGAEASGFSGEQPPSYADSVRQTDEARENSFNEQSASMSYRLEKE